MKKNLESSYAKSRMGCTVGVLVLLAAFVGGVIWVIIHYSSTSDSPATPNFRLERAVVDINGNQYELPGAIAYIDGREPYANPAFTLMRIPLWFSPACMKEVCKLKHGEEVELIEFRDTPNQERYVKIIRGGRNGWVLARYINADPTLPIGNEIYQ